MRRWPNETTEKDVLRYWTRKRPAARVDDWKISVGQSPDKSGWRSFAWRMKDDHLEWHYLPMVKTRAAALETAKRKVRKRKPTPRKRRKKNVPRMASKRTIGANSSSSSRSVSAKSSNPKVTLPARTLKRSPVGKVDDVDVAELGSVLEVEVDGFQISWPRGSVMLAWAPDKKALLLLEGGRRSKAGAVKDSARAAGAYERWAGRGATREAVVDLKPRGSWRSFGRVRRIDYHSDKWGRKREYTHRTGPGVRLYRYGSATKPPWLWVLKGGRLSVTARGITG